MAALPPQHFVSAEPYTVFLDESGDHNLNVVDPSYPVFGLCGIVMRSADHITASANLSAWKTGFFGRDVILHAREIHRSLNAFRVLRSAQVRRDFWGQLTPQIAAIPFHFIASVIHKQNHLNMYGNIADDPYNLTLEFIIERVHHDMQSRRSRAGIIAEGRQQHENAALQAHYQRLLATGTRFVSANDLQRRLPPAITFQAKHVQAAGLQMSDLVIGPVCRQVYGLQNTHCIDYVPKFRCSRQGVINGYGLKVFP